MLILDLDQPVHVERWTIRG